MGNKIEKVILAAVAGLGVYLILTGMGNVSDGMAAADWPTASGTVTETRVKSSSGRHSTSYTPIVAYSYEVDGEQHTSERLRAFDWGSSSRSKAQRKLEEYPIGSEQTVYYDPEDPASAMLIPGATWQTWALPGGGLFCIVVGVVGIATRREKKEQ